MDLAISLRVRSDHLPALILKSLMQACLVAGGSENLCPSLQRVKNTTFEEKKKPQAGAQYKSTAATNIRR
jgi:hypothetical protein